MPEKWNCEAIETHNATPIRITVCTHVHVGIPVIKSHNSVERKLFSTSRGMVQRESVLYSGMRLIQPKNAIIVELGLMTLKDTKTMSSSTSYKPPLYITGHHGKISPEETFDPENVKYQYIFDSIQLQINNELNILNQRSCQNRNNLFIIASRVVSHDNPTLTAKLILQRNDIIARRINGKLLVAPCKSKEMESTTVEFEAEIINKFENERIKAELEILARKHESIQLISET
ncbi:unnamed protein product [Acanthocheilonema viteae]|uniref:Uncharacterized protein n=1 Tax=Acanthocheilonema viteae TaxID=6277 RepID=A0A498SBT9_ACAVI|nr:unnamed protein product [Acanthocheilonema viteae]